MKITFILFLLAAIAVLSVEAGKNVTNIKDCSPLTPRNPPNSVHDLRPDDIRVIAALGDSVTAGFAVKGFESFQNRPLFGYGLTFKEYRGLSYSIGGDKGALTIPNYFKHYQRELKGYSTGVHAPEYCDTEDCNQPYIPELDGLNAARSGATAHNLDREVAYLIEQMKKMKGVDFENDWKIITIQIGSNDMCKTCKLFAKDYEKATPEKYEEYFEAALDKIQSSIPKVLVNLLSSYNVSQVITATEGKPYCNARGTIPNRLECACATDDFGLKKMQQLFQAYDKKLVSIYEKRQKKKSDTFAVVYQPHGINFDSCPPEYFSNQDCFHVGEIGHAFLSKSIWNQLFISQAFKTKIFNYDENETIYCPSDSDRIATN